MLKKSSKRFVSIVLAIAMILTMVPFAAFADETTASDLSGHWAENVITEWMDYGIINGYEDGTIRPNNKITRAEMTAMLDRVMDYQTKADNTFSDLGDSWYTDVILKANAAGVISGYPDGTVKPDATITRQEAVAMFSRVLSLDTKNAPEATFTDNADVADWAKDAVNAMAAADYIHGSDGQFRPNDGITRAEVVTILNNIFDKLYQKAGEYTGDVDGSAVINTDQVTLKDMTISGDLIIAEGVGDGHVVLDNVTVDGKLIVRGGGENSVIIKGDSKIDNISVERIDGAVRVAVEGNASVNAVLIDNGGQDVKIEGAVGTVNVASANVNVDITGAAKDINVADTATNATITLTSTATADKVSTSAENTTIIVAGTVSNIDIADTANNSVVTTQSGATIDKVTTAAGSTTVEGSGTVTNVVVGENASDATVTTEGTKVENNSSSNVTTGDDSVIAPGTTDTTPGSTTETPSVPSVPSGPSHTHNYVDGVCAADGAIDPSWAQVNSTATWNEAVEAGKNIVVTADFTTNAQLQITKAITVNGNGHTITAGTWTDANTTSKGDAHLVSINAGDNAVIIKNITLTGAKHIGDNYASGLNVYLSSNVTLDKVTLKDNEAAGMIVNGSTVTANGLTTSGNVWGGVNVDKGTNVTDATTFTFDAASTFAEDAKVYSDAGNVTVNAPEGWACTQVNGKYVWAKLFDDGNGSEEKPYLISNAEQFKAIEKLSNANNHFKLQNNIDMTNTPASAEDDYGDTGDIYQLYGELDGAGYSITGKDSTTGTILYAQNATIKNTTFIISGHPAVTNATNTTFETVTVIGEMEVGNNNGAFVRYAVPQNGEVTLTFNKCTANVTMLGDGGENNYNAVFVGYAYGGDNKTTLTFNNCINEGTLICGKAAMFLGNNSANQGIVTITANDCINRGEIRSTYTNANYGWNHFIATGAHQNNTIILDGITLSSATDGSIETEGSGIFAQGPSDATLKLTENEDKTFTITPASAENVAYYKVTMSLYASLLNGDGSLEGGTQVVSVSEQIDATTASDSYTTSLKHLSFVDEDWITQNPTATSTTEGENTLYTLNEISYYYFGSKADTHASLEGKPKAPQMISVSAYDSTGKLICSAALSK